MQSVSDAIACVKPVHPATSRPRSSGWHVQPVPLMERMERAPHKGALRQSANICALQPLRAPQPLSLLRHQRPDIADGDTPVETLRRGRIDLQELLAVALGDEVLGWNAECFR